MANFKDVRSVPSVPYVSSAKVLALVEGQLVQIQIGSLGGGSVPPELTQKVTQLEIGLTGCNISVLENTTRIAANTSSITTLNSRVTSLSTELSLTNSGLSGLVSTVTGLESSNTSNTQRIVSLEARPLEGTLADTPVAPGTYSYPSLTVNSKGQVTQASSNVLPIVYSKTETDNLLISKVSTNDSRLGDSRNPQGSAGGDLIGTYPNPVLANTSVTPGTYQYATVSIDSKGRVTSAISNSLPGSNSNIISSTTVPQDTTKLWQELDSKGASLYPWLWEYVGSEWRSYKLKESVNVVSAFDNSTIILNPFNLVITKIYGSVRRGTSSALFIRLVNINLVNPTTTYFYQISAALAANTLTPFYTDTNISILNTELTYIALTTTSTGTGDNACLGIVHYEYYYIRP